MSELHAEQDDSGMSEYEEYHYLKADAEKHTNAYLNLLRILPSHCDRTKEERRALDKLETTKRTAQQKLWAARGQIHWDAKI